MFSSVLPTLLARYCILIVLLLCGPIFFSASLQCIVRYGSCSSGNTGTAGYLFAEGWLYGAPLYIHTFETFIIPVGGGAIVGDRCRRSRVPFQKRLWKKSNPSIWIISWTSWPTWVRLPTVL
ncbi:hypothetical protein HOY80DRAFT_547732 [Tuber brumale]|nr:hypothetical protein HOY80DRAFT_547732 [Tuber brumale]